MNGGAAATLLLLVAGVPAAAPARAQAQEVRYTRSLEVSEAGWVRVPLGSEMLRRIEGGGGFRLFGPEGEEVPFRRRPETARARRRAVALREPVAGGGGWWLPLEVAPGSRPHERLVLALDGEAPRLRSGQGGAVRLEGSADGESWQLLVVGRLLAEGERLALAYPATGLPLLRLGWPGAPEVRGPPRIAAAAVEEVPPRSFRLSFARPDCRAREASPGSARTVCRLAVGGAGRYLRRLCFVVTSEGPAAHRLLAAEAGRWEAVSEEVWSLPAAETTRCLPLDLVLEGEADALRLELYGAGEEPPAIRDATAELAPELLVFRAARPGLYTLAYGPAVFGSSRGDGPPLPRGAAAAAVEPGAEEATELPAAGLALPASAGPAPAVTFEETWEVAADAAAPGDLHRLTLPPAVYAVAAPDLADLRLMAGEGSPGAPPRLQVPYARWRPEEPILAAERRGAQARPSSETGTARIDVEAPARGLPLSALVVSAAPGAAGASEAGFRLRLRVRHHDAGAGGESSVGPWVDWRCRDRPPLPCRATLVVEQTGARRLTLEIDGAGDGQGETAPRLDLELWRRRDVLLFPWPAGDATLSLAAGAEGLEPPEYGLAGRLPELLARPWREARLAAEEGAAAGGRLGSVAITLTLLAAAAALLVLLHRILAEQALR